MLTEERYVELINTNLPSIFWTEVLGSMAKVTWKDQVQVFLLVCITATKNPCHVKYIEISVITTNSQAED